MTEYREGMGWVITLGPVGIAALGEVGRPCWQWEPEVWDTFDDWRWD